jgi:hypothetical protein
MRRVIGKPRGDAKPLIALIDEWTKAGGQRLDVDGDNLYEHSAGVALFDQWWPLFVRASFQPALGKDLFGKVEGFLSLSSTVSGDWGWSWSSHVEKDLRMVLGRRVRGAHSRLYCGGKKRRGARKRCRALLLRTLTEGAKATADKYGSPDPAQWKIPALCEDASPPLCDQNVPTALGAVDTPAFPWQNRGTYHQVVELTGHR